MPAIVLAAAGLLGLFALTPSVVGAPALVKAILAAHHAPGDHGIVPGKVGQALLATEDSRFYGDTALDPRGVLRAAWGALQGNSNAGGATIELQLAKLLYTPGSSSPAAEVEQAALAFKLDHDFTKTEIFTMYLNAAYFGDGAQGVTKAAQHYFGRAPGDLSWAQATLLAGLVQAPTAYDPRFHLRLARQRQGEVLNRLVAVGVFTRTQAHAVAEEPLHPAVPFTSS